MAYFSLAFGSATKTVTVKSSKHFSRILFLTQVTLWLTHWHK